MNFPILIEVTLSDTEKVTIDANHILYHKRIGTGFDDKGIYEIVLGPPWAYSYLIHESIEDIKKLVAFEIIEFKSRIGGES